MTHDTKNTKTQKPKDIQENVAGKSARPVD